MKNRAKTITNRWAAHTGYPTHTFPKRVSSRQHTSVIVITSSLGGNTSNPEKTNKWLRLRQDDHQTNPHCRGRAEKHENQCQNSTTIEGQRSSDSDKELWRRTRQGWRRRRSPNGPPVASHRTPPGSTTAASTSQQQTSRGKPTNTPEKSRLPQLEPRLQHSSTPPSLP
jgi:hypothetical protein